MIKISFGNKYMPSEQNLFFEEAKKIANNSLCRSAKVGAIIVSKDNEIIGKGYNTIPDKISSCLSLNFCPRRRILRIIPNFPYQHSCQAIHAEQNALLSVNNKSMLKDSSLFLYGIKSICDNCRLLLISQGIKDFYIKLINS